MRPLVFFVAVGLVACSNEGDPGSCYRDRDNACVEYGRAKAGAGKRLCDGMRWIPGERSCPTEGRLGACVKKTGSDYVYGGPPNNYSLTAAKNACEWGGGVFLAGSAATPPPAASSR